MTNMISITRHFPDPIINTGISFNINDPSSFKEAFEKLKAYNEAKKDALADALGFSENVEAKLEEAKASEATKTSETTENASKWNTSLRWFPSVSEMNTLLRKYGETSEEWRIEKIRETIDKERDERIAGTWKIPVGRDELRGLMEDIEEALANGEPFFTALEKQIAKHSYADGSMNVSSHDVDFFWIDICTGEVKDAAPRMRTMYVNEEFESAEEDAVWDLAYDLQQFLKLRVFGETDGMSDEEVEVIISDIKSRQFGKDYSRFIDYTREEAISLSGKTIDPNEKDEDTETEEAIDKFIKELAEHQERMNLQRHNGGYGKKKSANEASEIYGETRSRVFKGLSA